MQAQGIYQLGMLLSEVNRIMSMKFSIWGFSISAWNVLAFDVIVGTAGWFVWEVILGDR